MSIINYYELYDDSTGHRVLRGEIGRSIELEQAVQTATRELSVMLTDSGRSMHFCYKGRKANLYLAVNPEETPQGKLAMQKFRLEEEMRRSLAAKDEDQSHAELQSILALLGREEALSVLRQAATEARERAAQAKQPATVPPHTTRPTLPTYKVPLPIVPQGGDYVFMTMPGSIAEPGDFAAHGRLYLGATGLWRIRIDNTHLVFQLDLENGKCYSPLYHRQPLQCAWISKADFSNLSYNERGELGKKEYLAYLDHLSTLPEAEGEAQ